jgi:hypothetical protein
LQAEVKLWLVFIHALSLRFVQSNPADGVAVSPDLLSRPFFTRFLKFGGAVGQALKNRLTSDDFKIRMPALGRDTKRVQQNVLKLRRV